MKRILGSTLMGVLVCGAVAALSFTGCQSKPASPAAQAEKAKLVQAEAAFKAAGKSADGALAKKPKDYDGAIKAYTDAKSTVAGTAYDKKCTDAIADLTKDKNKAAAEAAAVAAKAAEKAKQTKAEDAFKAAAKSADAALAKTPKDFDGAIKAYTDAKPAVAGTSYDKKVADELAALAKAKVVAATPDPKAAEKAKLAAAETAYKAAEKTAEAALAKTPKDYDAAIKAYTDAKVAVAGTRYDKKVADEIADLTKTKDKGALDAKDAAAKTALKTAEKAADAALDKKPKDFDAAIKAYTDAKPAVAGTVYDKKVSDELAALAKAKADAAKLPVVKVEPPKPVVPAIPSIAEALGKPVEGVKTTEEAWKKAEELEKAADKPERARLSAALPYYLFVLKTKDAEGKFDIQAPEAALRIAKTIDKYADNTAERVSAAKFYMVSSSLNLGSDAWEKAEKPYVNAGKGGAFAGYLKALAQNASARSTELAASGDADDQAQAAKLKKFSASVGKRADTLTAKYVGK